MDVKRRTQYMQTLARMKGEEFVVGESEEQQVQRKTPGEEKKDKKDEDDDEQEICDLTATPWGCRQEVGIGGAETIATGQIILNSTRYMEHEVFKEEQYAKVREDCKNRHPQCAFWAFKGECEANPKYMTLHCAPSCYSCDMVAFEARCPLNETVPQALYPGDLDRMFQKIATDDYYQQFTPTILSMPEPTEQGIKEGPWVVTLDNLLTEEECNRLIELGAEAGYEISRDVGKRKFDGSYDGFSNDRRTSTNAWCNEACYNDTMTKNVLGKIENVTGIPDDNSEYLQLLQYEVGQCKCEQ